MIRQLNGYITISRILEHQVVIDADDRALDLKFSFVFILFVFDKVVEDARFDTDWSSSKFVLFTQS